MAARTHQSIPAPLEADSQQILQQSRLLIMRGRKARAEAAVLYRQTQQLQIEFEKRETWTALILRSTSGYE